MATATETLKSEDVAIATTKDSKPTKPKKAGGRPAGYSPLLPFSTTKTEQISRWNVSSCHHLCENVIEGSVTVCNDQCPMFWI